MEPKKLLILRILQILEEHSDEMHPLTQQNIIGKLEKEYGIVCERKAVGRNISYLIEAGYEIVGDGNGVYLLSREFERSELRMLIDSVLTSRYIDKKHSEDLIKKLLKKGGKYFKAGCRHLYYNKEWNKSENKTFFYNIEILDEAIEKEKKVVFRYNYYDKDKKLVPRKEEPYLVNPYRLLLHNQRYYLICNIDKYADVRYLRVDRITDIEIIDSVAKPLKTMEGYAEGLNLSALDTSLPYMFGDRAERITLRFDCSLMGDIIDWFGRDFPTKELPDGRMQAVVRASPQSMKFWALQYGGSAEIVSPEGLRQAIKDTVQHMQSVYQEDK